MAHRTTSPDEAKPTSLVRAARNSLRRARFEIVTLLGRYPGLIPLLAPFRRGESVTRDSAIVIEGFPRSGNTFATAAFDLANRSPSPKLAHHVHSPGQVIAAIRLRIPTLVVIRPPEEAVLSFVVQQPHISLRQAIRAYVRFHRTLLPHRGGFVVATFAEVVSDFGAVTRRLNQRFGTDFGEFEPTDENIREALDLIEADNRQRWDGRDLETKGAVPSELRTRIKQELRERYRANSLRPLREEAEHLYHVFTHR
jgi:hypothetical protein